MTICQFDSRSIRIRIIVADSIRDSNGNFRFAGLCYFPSLRDGKYNLRWRLVHSTAANLRWWTDGTHTVVFPAFGQMRRLSNCALQPYAKPFRRGHGATRINWTDKAADLRMKRTLYVNKMSWPMLCIRPAMCNVTKFYAYGRPYADAQRLCIRPA